MKKFLTAALIAGSLLNASPANAEVKNYDGVGEYVMSDFETPDVAKQRAKMYAERNAQEKAGVYIKSYSRAENFELVADEIESMTHGILKVISVDYDVVPTKDDGVLYRAIIVAEIDTDNVDEWISRSISERKSLVEKNRELQRQIDEQEKVISELKKRAEKSKDPEVSKKFQREFKQSDKNFMSNLKLEEGNRYVLVHADWAYEKAEQYWTEAIELNPKNALAYEARGYYYLYYTKNYSAGIDDYTRAIELRPNNADNYFFRGVCLLNSDNFDAAKSDFERALSLNPQMSAPLAELAYIYTMSDPLKAIDFADRALIFDDRNWRALYSRGLALFTMHNYEAALEDGKRALELGCGGDAYQLIGDCYGMLGLRDEAEKYWELAKNPPAYG